MNIVEKILISNVSKHSIAAPHPTVTLDNLTGLSIGYQNRNIMRKVLESLFIKENRPKLNKHGTSVPLKSFN